MIRHQRQSMCSYPNSLACRARGFLCSMGRLRKCFSMQHEPSQKVLLSQEIFFSVVLYHRPVSLMSGVKKVSAKRAVGPYGKNRSLLRKGSAMLICRIISFSTIQFATITVNMVPIIHSESWADLLVSVKARKPRTNNSACSQTYPFCLRGKKIDFCGASCSRHIFSGLCNAYFLL